MLKILLLNLEKFQIKYIKQTEIVLKNCLILPFVWLYDYIVKVTGVLHFSYVLKTVNSGIQKINVSIIKKMTFECMILN